jgi:hypothetical protein
MQDAPAGYEWKDVEMRIGKPLDLNGRRFVYLGTGGMNLGLAKVLVRAGEPAIKKIDLEGVLRNNAG